MRRFSPRHAAARAAFVAIVGACVVAAMGPVHARERLPQRSERLPERSEVRVAALPAEARDVLELIRTGGPFRFERDGVNFGNREHALPPRSRGFYHEYTVATPGMRTRGARRIVCGGARRAPEVCYYSDDHYATFRRIRE